MGKILWKPKQVVVYYLQRIVETHDGFQVWWMQMMAMVMDMIHEVKTASTADAVVPFPHCFLSKNAQRNYIHIIHTSIHH